MPLVSDTQLAALRAVANNGLDSTTATAILRSVQIENDFGSEDSWATVLLDVPCWLREMSSTNVGSMASRLVTTGTYRCHFEAGLDVQAGDHVVIDDTTYDVQGTNVENTIQIFTTAVMRKVE
jgi:hypothetical protein